MIIQQHKNKIIGGAVGLLLSSPFLLHFTTGFEGERFKTYLDPIGKPTACVGITGKDIVVGKTYTKAQCDAFLAQRMQEAGKGVVACLHKPLNQNQYNAFADLAFNLGAGGFCRSSIASEFNQGNYARACDHILLYNKAGGKVLPGLVKRRESERKLCLTPVQTVVAK